MTTVRSGVFRLLVIATVLFAGTSSASAQQAPPDNGGRRSVAALRLADGETVTLDGQLDEPFWSRTVPAADFVQIDPANGMLPTEPTEVRIAFDGDALYLGVTCYDSEPDLLLGFQRRRDQGLVPTTASCGRSTHSSMAGPVITSR